MSTTATGLLPQLSVASERAEHPKKKHQMVRAESSLSWKYDMTTEEPERARETGRGR